LNATSSAFEVKPAGMASPFDAQPSTSEGIDVLMELAKKGKIDPWNVDIAKVTDEYLAYVEGLSEAAAEASKTQQTHGQLVLQPVIDVREQAHMRLTGKTLLYLAILLRMKSDLLAGFDPFEQDYLEDADLEDLREYDAQGNLIDVNLLGREVTERLQQAVRARYGTLNDVLKRRSSAKLKRVRQVTLEDLISELKKYEALERERATRQKVERVDRRRNSRILDYGNLSTEDIAQLAHDEFQEETVQWVHQVLELYLEKTPEENTAPIDQNDNDMGYVSASKAHISLSELCDLCETDTVSVFLSLLFLEARHIVFMEQPDFYSSDIFVRWHTSTDDLAHTEVAAS
jgi:segregation and condensation protein A